MTRLALEQAPAASLPRRFLLSAPLWGMLAGVLRIVDGDALLRTRWDPATLQLQIVGFLGWIQLHRRCGRGVHLPGVQRLLPEANQVHVLRVFLVSALLLPAAVLWPRAWLVRGAGLAVLLAYGVLWWALLEVRRRADRFVMTTEGRA
jgi:hypothetical protein